MSWYKKAQTNRISLQEATDLGLFGPVYHGTSETSRAAISEEGFQIFEGEERSGGISHGYEKSDYHGGIPAPIHHLGYGVYFTTVKNIAKQFNNDSLRGLMEYYLNIPNTLTINWGAPSTMMKWWIEQGYDPNIAKQDRVIATKMMTSNLASQYDAVWYKGKGIRKLLDGDQICVYDTSKIYQIDRTLTQTGDVGSRVKRLSDGMIGNFIAKRSIDPEISKKYHNGEPYFMTIKWKKGGTEYNVYPSQIEFI